MLLMTANVSVWFRKDGLVLLLIAIAFLLAPVAQGQEVAQVPVKGMVTMVDIGATECIPCKAMAPILEKLKGVYAGRAAVVFIDVWKNPEQGRKFGIRAIPTQVFYDAEGKEITRHVGFMDEAAIVAQLSRMGVK
jgi:thioredoxin 1